MLAFQDATYPYLMKILIAPDKFKGALTAREVAHHIATGIRETLPAAEIEEVPVADGGEGTAEVLCQALGGSWSECAARDAFARPVTARYVWLPEHATAVMQMSEVAGFRQARPDGFDIGQATTFGVGEMMVAAARRGAREIIAGLGGSVTNDGGYGMARALGFRFFAKGDRELGEMVSDLRTLVRIDTSDVVEVLMRSTDLKKNRRLAQPPPQLVHVIAAADVRNPLLGENGASRVFGPQKGATPEQIPILEEALARMVDVIATDLGVDYRATPGAGAAGGLAFGLMSFCGASIRPGFEVVAEAIGLENKIRSADIIVTGEGSLDRQTLEGKAPAEVARIGRRLGKRVFAVVGRSDGDARLRELFDGIYVAADHAGSEAESIAQSAELLREGGRELAASLLLP
ncbi:MAG TPA: glycerate kinase [Chthoniobacterales bacterium]